MSLHTLKALLLSFTNGPESNISWMDTEGDRYSCIIDFRAHEFKQLNREKKQQNHRVSGPEPCVGLCVSFPLFYCDCVRCGCCGRPFEQKIINMTTAPS